MDLADLPQFTLDQLLLRGLVLDTDLLKGWSIDRLDSFRNRADQAGCPCLVLRESVSVPADSKDEDVVESTMSRLGLVARAAQRLGCNAMSLVVGPMRGDAAMNRASDFLRQVMERIDRMELNLLIEPGGGDLADPEKLIQLIKKVGGFRIGTMPNFLHAVESGDPEVALRQTAPYAGAMLASCGWTLRDGSSTGGAGGKKKSKRKKKKKTTGAAASEGAKPPTLSEEETDRIRACVEAIRNVGYGQILAIDYVGKGDGAVAIDQARQVIENVLETE